MLNNNSQIVELNLSTGNLLKYSCFFYKILFYDKVTREIGLFRSVRQIEISILLIISKYFSGRSLSHSPSEARKLLVIRTNYMYLGIVTRYGCYMGCLLDVLSFT